MPTDRPQPTAEHRRLREIQHDNTGWRRWGPYVSDRSWATVREDYSADGNAWGYLPHDLARSKAYRWGEDAIAGICDRYQLLCFAPAFWNGRDPILKERLFGVTPAEGNHGEDVKEYYFYVDNTPTHSYMRMLYKYPQAEFPYGRLIDENRARGGNGPEFELLDTGVFEGNRYFDIEIEYAKVDEEDLVARIEAHNRGPEAATLHVLPHLWFRNRWAWGAESWGGKEIPEPKIRRGEARDGLAALVADDATAETLANIPIVHVLGERTLYGPPGGAAMFTNNETNGPRVFGPGATSRKKHVKDAFHRHLIGGEDCLNPANVGTKAALHYTFEIPAGGSVVLRLRLTGERVLADPLGEVDALVARRRAEADEFYAAIHPPGASVDERAVQRQAFAGLLWTKQSYIFDVNQWLQGDFPDSPPPPSRLGIRNSHWKHLNSMRVMTVPDKWEYPWFAAWDLAFHCVSFALIDPKYAMDQLWVLLFEQFQHQNGQIPAYEWEFSDLNPPVHGWAVWRVYYQAHEFHKRHYGDDEPDRAFLERCFHKLLINFAWWINKVDREGNNVFEGGFLGLDNISVVDRSMMGHDGTVLEQADATGWMGMFCLGLMRIALELSRSNPVYEGLATKFFQHYASVANAMKHMGNRDEQLWDSKDGFFYDMMRRPSGELTKFRVRSLVGLIPLFAVERLEVSWMKQFREFSLSFEWFLKNRPDLVREVVHQVHDDAGEVQTHVLTIVNKEQLQRLLARMFDPSEFLSDYGIRSLSKAHEAQPFVFEDKVVGYEPAEAVSKIKGGNSNWRGPIWFPTTFLLIESLRKLGKAWGSREGLEPAGLGRLLTYRELGGTVADRMIGLFARDPATGRRPVYGDCPVFQRDEHWRDHILFYEYFHGDTGAGLGASHQTGWTALVASLIDEWRRDPRPEGAPSNAQATNGATAAAGQGRATSKT